MEDGRAKQLCGIAAVMPMLQRRWRVNCYYPTKPCRCNGSDFTWEGFGGGAATTPGCCPTTKAVIAIQQGLL